MFRTWEFSLDALIFLSLSLSLSLVSLELDLQSCSSESLSEGGLLSLKSLTKITRLNLYRVSAVTDNLLTDLIQ